ncbi:MAG: gamma-glutamyltransferase [Halothiobacillaceae bacterium]
MIRRFALAVLLSALSLTAPWASAGEPPADAVASAHPLATQAALDILAEGGNAFDAAITATAMLAVVEPYGSGLGGGGFYLLHRAADGRDIMLDAREIAPLDADSDLYLDEEGEVIPLASMNGGLAAGIPGIPAALVRLADHYGRLPLSATLAPAIEVAREGFAVTESYRRMADFRGDAMRMDAETARIFLADDETPELGALVRQPELAETMQTLAEQGFDGFYTGEMADRLVSGVRAAGGIWRRADLERYRVIERAPLRARFGDQELVTVGPPSSGGVALIQMLRMLEPLAVEDRPETERVHLIAEAMRRAYRDRAQYLGDSDFYPVPVDRLTSADYAAGLRAGIHPARATPSDLLPPVRVADEGPHTTHFSILDRAGNRVSATLSINYPFGAATTVPGTGVLLNNEMDDFAARPGHPNAYGLVGAEANAIEPGKRPLSSMSPSFLVGPDRIAILGTPGGSRIITMVLQGLMSALAGDPVTDWVSAARFHHQYLPDELLIEPAALAPETIKQLERMGHTVREAPAWGNMQAILWEREANRVTAASDPRVEGTADVR